MRFTTRIRALGVGLSLAVALVASPGLTGHASPAVTASADDPSYNLARGDVALFGPRQDPLGKPWAHWDMRWSRWFQQVPFKKNPAVEPDSAKNCHVSGPIVLMGPTGNGSGCTVPLGKSVLFTALGWSCSTAEGNGRSWQELRACTRRSWEVELSDVRLTMVFDGLRIREPLRWLVESRRYTVDFPENNIWGVEAGKSRSLDRSVMWMTEPAGRGTHLIRVKMLEAGQKTVYKWRWKVR